MSDCDSEGVPFDKYPWYARGYEGRPDMSQKTLESLEVAKVNETCSWGHRPSVFLVRMRAFFFFTFFTHD